MPAFYDEGPLDKLFARREAASRTARTLYHQVEATDDPQTRRDILHWAELAKARFEEIDRKFVAAIAAAAELLRARESDP